MDLKDKTVLVIGGGSGIGRGIAEGAAREGARVVIASTSIEKLTRTAAEIGSAASIARIDVTDEADIAAFFAANSGFDHIAYTAGDWNVPPAGPLAELDIGRAADVLKVRFWGAIAVGKHGATRLPNGGSYTITSGMLAHMPSKGRPLWTAVAGAIEALATGLAVDLAPVRVNCVCPGLIRTEQWDVFPPAYRDRLVEQANGQLVPGPGMPAQAAESYLYAMRNTFVTGQVLCVEGGVALAG